MSILLSALIDSGGGAGGVSDGREFKRWQDFYGEHSGPNAYHCEITQSQRTVNGVAVNRMVQTTTWTVPSGVSKIRVTAIGAGGGGGRYSSTYHGSGGGAGGAFSSGEFNVTAGQVLDVQVGRSGYGIDRSQGAGTGVAGPGPGLSPPGSTSTGYGGSGSKDSSSVYGTVTSDTNYGSVDNSNYFSSNR